MTTSPIGVGFIGAGPVTQSIHIPALIRLSETFRIAHVTDVDETVARTVAERVDARHSTSIDELLADEAVEVVAVCSPPRFHAEQVIAACRAGVKLVLCEKPFATSAAEAELIAAAAEETGVPIIVGAMHSFDPAWTSAATQWGDLETEADFVRSAIYMPGGTRFEDFATEVLKRPTPPPPTDLNDADARARRLEGIVLGLIIHDLPLVRRFAPSIQEILAADIGPRTWSVLYRGSGRTVQLTGGMVGGFKPEWTFEAHSSRSSLEVEFNPSYVWAGSGTSAVTTDGVRSENARRSYNGYEGEWKQIAAVVRDGQKPSETSGSLIDDLRYALDLIAATKAHITGRSAA